VRRTTGRGVCTDDGTGTLTGPVCEGAGTICSVAEGLCCAGTTCAAIPGGTACAAAPE